MTTGELGVMNYGPYSALSFSGNDAKNWRSQYIFHIR